MMRFHTYIVVFLLTLCGGCGGWGGWNQDLSSGPTLADLEPIELASVETPVPRLALEELAAIYRDVLGYQDDPQTRLEILHRLADIEMLVGEEGMAEGVNKQALLGPAIAAYEKLLRENPDYPARDTIAYQLSKAYDLRGDTQRSMQTLSALKQANPDSPYIAEASFRLAERHFANANYASSEALYAQVVDFGSDTPFYTRGLYMQGWSRFKQDRFADAIEPFTKSLDHHLRGDIEGVDLPRAQRELVEDSLRVLALSFSNLGGTDSIAQAY
ncbi:MAG: tol-pal system YbgF family protein, partial [Halioglobus sp.]